jgi:hypothetical protein
MPPYPGVSQVMEVTREQIEGTLQSQTSHRKKIQAPSSTSMSSWEEEYASYLAEKYSKEGEADTSPSAALLSLKDNNGSIEQASKVKEESWELQYAAYCAEKEARLAKEDAKNIELMRKQLQE